MAARNRRTQSATWIAPVAFPNHPEPLQSLGAESPREHGASTGAATADDADALQIETVAAAIAERDWFAAERDAAITAQFGLIEERDAARNERRRLAEERDALAAARDALDAQLRRARDQCERLMREAATACSRPREASDGPTVFAAYEPPVTEAGKAYRLRLASGFFDRYCRGDVVLDVGFVGASNPDARTSLPGAIGVDLDYPGYDGRRLPWPDGSVDCIFASHCLEHVGFYQEIIRDWHRVLKLGGHIVCMVPSRDLYEKKRFPPSRYNEDHKRFYTASRLAAEFEEALEPNSFRIRHLHENDHGYNYAIGPERHADGCYEIEIVVEKIAKPDWILD